MTESDWKDIDQMFRYAILKTKDYTYIPWQNTITGEIDSKRYEENYRMQMKRSSELAALQRRLHKFRAEAAAADSAGNN